VRQITANDDGILGFDCHIKFPVAQRRSRKRKNSGRSDGGLRCWSAGQPDGNQIDVFEKAAVPSEQHCADSRGSEWACYFYVCVGAHSERVISWQSHALGLKLQIDSGLRELGKRERDHPL